MAKEKKEKQNKKDKNKVTKNPITKDMTIGEVVQKYPEAIPVMMQHGMHCIGCHVSFYETIEQGASSHGIDVSSLIKDMNKTIKERK